MVLAYHHAYNKKYYNYIKKGIKNRDCLLCQKDFKPASSNQVFCGNRDVEGSCAWKNKLSTAQKYAREHAPVYQWGKGIFMRFGLTAESYWDLYKKQNGKCFICGKKSSRKLGVDHCHKTNKVRGLLCVSCNVGLGHFKDSTELLKKAIRYLKNPPVDIATERQNKVGVQ